MFGKLPSLTGSYYTIQVRFESVGGVAADTPVRKSGILIGRVRDLRLTDHDTKVLVTLNIQSDKTIYQNEDCYIMREVLGDTAVVFIPDRRKEALRDKPVAPGSTLVGVVSDDPTGLKTRFRARSTPSKKPAKRSPWPAKNSARPPSGLKTS